MKRVSLYNMIFHVVMLLFISGGLSAHHSNTPFDMSRMLETTGVVEKVNFKNPHSLLTLRIRNERVNSAVTYEGHSLATLRHYGLKPSMVKEGETITISYAPRRDNEPGGIFLKILTSTGEMMDFSLYGYE